MSKKMNLIMENWRRFVNEEVSPEQVDTNKFPQQLSKVDQSLAAQLAGEQNPGLPDKDKQQAGDDVVKTEDASIAAKDLNPYQTSMDPPKFVGMAIGMIIKKKYGGSLNAVISKDNYIMDGHHRWAATLITSPDSLVSGVKADLPAEKLVGVLNVLTKGRYGKLKGNPGQTPWSSITPELIEKIIRDMVANGIAAGPIDQNTGKPAYDATPKEKIVEALTEYGGGNIENAIKKIKQNAEILANKTPGGPDRENMPVIAPEKVADVKDAFNTGKIDIVSAAKAGATPVQKESLKKIVRQVIRENLKRR